MTTSTPSRSVQASGRGAAVGAATLAILNGIFWALLAQSAAEGADIYAAREVGMQASDLARKLRQLTYICGVESIIWFASSMLLLCRRSLGRTLVIASSAFAILHLVGTAIGDSHLIPLALAILPLITLILASARSTGRWVAA
ncbi:hypothetical protein [Nocardia sp. NPDC058666]|uniref:hypothetical protein n=1 Tax=Nocardia sp. NPDC058666 TaxID=3346587 RepID=UPI0036647CE2